MRKRTLRKALCSTIAFVMLASGVCPVFANAQEPSWKTGIKDHWDFSTTTSNMGDKTKATLHGVELVDSENPVFGKVLRFGGGADKYMKLDKYINTGAAGTSFSLWYRYDTSITGDDANKSAVLLQHEGNGRSLLVLQGDGHYNTFINQQNVHSKKAVPKGDWQHVTVTFDQENNQVSYYINGEFDGSQNMGNSKVNEVLSLRLGAHKESGNMDPHPMRGDVDEFYVYDKVLTADEAKAV